MGDWLRRGEELESLTLRTLRRGTPAATPTVFIDQEHRANWLVTYLVFRNNQLIVGLYSMDKAMTLETLAEAASALGKFVVNDYARLLKG